MELKRKGFFFSIDALIAVFLIFLVLMIYNPSDKVVVAESDLQEDVIKALSTMKVGEVKDNWTKTKIENKVFDPNKTLIDQISALSISDIESARNLTKAVLGKLETDENIQISVGGISIFSINKTNLENATRIEISRQIVSGLQEGVSATGFSARAYLEASHKTDYYFFGGYVGDGNLSVFVNYTGVLDSVNVEIALNESYSVYVNNVSVMGSFPVSSSDFIPVNFSIPNSYFSAGNNTIEFRGDKLHVAGGFIKLSYKGGVFSDSDSRYSFIGVDGLINTYDGFYVKSGLESIEAVLHLNSSIVPIFLNFGNVTIWRGNTSGEQTITISNATFGSALGSYISLAGKTVPIRLGMENATISGQNRSVDVFSITDLSGSMGGNPITQARNATNALIDVILNNSGNKVGLAGYESFSKLSDFHNLSNNSVSLKNTVNVWDASGSTCICCGIMKAISCYETMVFSDNFNGQSAGTNPSGWGVGENGGIVDIVSPGIEGGSGVKINRTNANTNGQNPYLRHYFAPQQNNITIEFAINHTYNGRNGKAVINIDSAQSNFDGFNNYLVLKMNGTSILNSSNSHLAFYNKNEIVKIKVAIGVNSNKFGLYINGSLIGSDLVAPYSRDNVARIMFTTESNISSYFVDNVSIYLTNPICESSENNRTRAFVVMSDGEANRGCGFDSSVSVTNIPQAKQDAIDAACLAFQSYNITVHSVGFGSADDITLRSIAENCGHGNYSYANITDIVSVYQNIANQILQTTFVGQTVSGGAYSRVYPDSHISFSYPLSTGNATRGLVLTLEQNFTNSTFGSFNIPSGSSPVSANVISYSGARWTSKVIVNNNLIYNLSTFGNDFTKLGDPYKISIPISLLNTAQNNVSLNTGYNSLVDFEGSNNNKIIFSINKTANSFTDILPLAGGCNWAIQFNDDSQLTVSIPFGASDSCVYNVTKHSNPNTGPIDSSNSVANLNDAAQMAVFDLLKQLDVDSDGKVDFIFSANDLQIDLDQINGIPFVSWVEFKVKRWIP